MFKRRTPRTRAEHFREAVWPSMGLKRLGVYYKHRMGRLQGTPNYIASGLATGVAISFTPFVGLHMITGTIICWLTGGSIVAMILGSLMSGNFWTFPFIWIVTYKLGHLMMGHVKTAEFGGTHVPDQLMAHDKEPYGPFLPAEQFTLANLIHHPMELFLPMTLGCIPFCIVFWVFTFFMCQQIIIRYKAARAHRIAKRHGKVSEK